MQIARLFLLFLGIFNLATAAENAGRYRALEDGTPQPPPHP